MLRKLHISVVIIFCLCVIFLGLNIAFGSINRGVFGVSASRLAFRIVYEARGYQYEIRYSTVNKSYGYKIFWNNIQIDTSRNYIDFVLVNENSAGYKSVAFFISYWLSGIVMICLLVYLRAGISAIKQGRADGA